MGTNGDWFVGDGPAVAISSVALEDVRESSLSILEQVTSQMAAAAPLSQFLADILELLASVVKYDAGFVYCAEGEDLVLRASKGLHSATAERQSDERLRLKSAAGLGAGLKPLAISQNAHADPRFQLFNGTPMVRFESFLSMPLLSRGRLMGVLNLQSRVRHFHGAVEVRTISAVAILMTAQIEIAVLEKENQDIAERLETRKLLDRAKGILQRDLKISEEDAYLMLQRQSQQRRRPMRDIAEAIVLSHAVTQDAPERAASSRR